MAQPSQVTLDIEDEVPAEPGGRNNPTLQRLDSISRPVPTNRSNLGIGDRIHSVIREIRPLVENARMGNNARLSLPTWLPRNPPVQQQSLDLGMQRAQSSIAHVNLGPNTQTYIVNDRGTSPTHRPGLSTSASNDSNLSEQAHEQPEVDVSVNPANNNNIPDNNEPDNQSDDGNQQQILDITSALKLLIKYAPFYFILFIKVLYDKREGIFTFCVLFCTFLHSNSLVRREHGKQMNRSMGALIFELISTIGCIVLVHFLFGHGILLPNVLMFPSYPEFTDIWELLWLVVLSDLIVKIITVDIKILITITPAACLPFQKRGKVFMFVEAISQMYRALLTIHPWVYYLLESYSGGERMVGMFLTSVYVLAKAIEMLMRMRLFKNATWTLLQTVTLGAVPTREQLLAAGDSCPICHDDYTSPVRLECSHIFCELCIAAWLDREHTCPLCRAKVTDEPAWRDGSTTQDFQLY